MTTPTPNAANHYVNNAEFYQAIVEYRNRVALAEVEGKPKPKIPDYIGDCLLKIANKLSYSRNFINYRYRDEMVSDGVENCIMYFHNFNPDKYNNPFSYFTQIVYYAFLRRIHREKRQMYIRHKAMMNQIDEGLAEHNDYNTSDEFDVSIDEKMTDNYQMNEFVRNFEEKLNAKKKASKAKSSKGIEEFFADPDPSVDIDPEVE